jgi:integrase
LISSNPWKNFTWIEGTKKPLRQFDQSELLSLLDYFKNNWPGLNFPPAFVKLCVWSWARRLEVSKLRWSDMRCINDECHFETEGKWGVTKWFRIPDCLRKELEGLRTEKNEYVFGCYPDQLRDFLVARGGKKAASRVRQDFLPTNLGEWMYREVAAWSKNSPNGKAYLHVFRKTSLQFAVSSAHVEQSVADDASVSSSVMMASYANIRDEELRHMSNRTFRRIRSSLSSEVAARYGWDQKPEDGIIEQLDQARLRRDWDAVTQLAAKLQQVSEQDGAST